MVLGLFKKHPKADAAHRYGAGCPVCGQDVEKEKAVKRFGKYHCSEEHAEEYRKKLAQEESSAASRGGGCCGK